MTTAVILQSAYLPWKGYFHLIQKADYFVFLESVQYTSRDWRNRNKIMTDKGTRWLTVPVHGSQSLKLKDVKTDIKQDWAKKHLEQIRWYYQKSPHFDEVFSILEKNLNSQHKRSISDLNKKLIKDIACYLDLKTQFFDDYEFGECEGKNERLIHILKSLKANTYLTGPKALGYLDISLFEKEGIQVEVMDYPEYPEYEHLFGSFDHQVSIIDLLFHHGQDSGRYIWSFVKPFNIPLVINKEITELSKVIKNRKFSGGGPYQELTEKKLQEIMNCGKVFLTPSCTSALEIIALTIGISSGDEILVPSFTHVSTVSSFVKYGALPVWVDIDPHDLNISIGQIKSKITKKTKALIAVHYAGFACHPEELSRLCGEMEIFFIEDAAQCIGSYMNNRHLGTFGDFAVLSFHETKNIHCGEGGALIVNNPQWLDLVQKIHDRGTNREDFNNKKVKQYTWHTLGSNYSLPELSAGFLYTQLNNLKHINQKRKALFDYYMESLSAVVDHERLPQPVNKDEHNGHCFYFLAQNENERNELIAHLRKSNYQAVFHYQPLHLAPFWHGKYDHESLPFTQMTADCIIRLPMHYDLTFKDIDLITASIREYYLEKSQKSR